MNTNPSGDAAVPAPPHITGRRTAHLQNDLWGGLAAMLVALPSAIAFGVTIYAPLGGTYAAYGALAGILGATALGLIASSLGGTERLITAPCAPAAAVLSALAIQNVAAGTPATTIVLMLTVIALLTGIIQIAVGVVGLGKLIKYMPYPVVSGYLSGVGLIIITTQVPKMLRTPQSIAIGIVTMLAMWLGPKLTKKVPGTIIGVIGGVATYFILAAFDRNLLTLSGNKLVIGPLAASGGAFLDGMAGRWEAVRHITPAQLLAVFVPALTLAMLLSIDTLKTCIVLDTITRSRHQSNRELIGQGCGNIVSAVVGGVPGSGTMGASLVNVSSGAQTRLSSVLEGAFSLVAFLALGMLIAWIPVATLAGILVVVGVRMLDRTSLTFLRSRSTILDFVVILVVVVTALTVGLIEASGVGVALAIMLFIREQIRGSILHAKLYGNECSSKRVRLPAEMEVLRKQGDQAVIFELRGSLFFGTTDQLYTIVEPELAKRRYVLFDLRRVQSVDITAVHMLEQIETILAEHKAYLLFSNVGRTLPSGRDIQQYFDRLGLVHAGTHVEVFDEIDDALEWIEDRILIDAGLAGSEEELLDLREMSLFEGRRDETLVALQDCMERRSCAAGEKVFAIGDRGDELYLIRRGSVRIMLPLTEGRQHHLSTFGRGDFFGEMAFIDKAPRSADAVAFMDTDLYVLSRARFDTFAQTHFRTAHTLIEALARALAIRLRHTNAELSALER